MANVDYFHKLDGIPGEATADKHKDEIQLESFSWGETNAGTSGHGPGSGAGKVVMQDFHFVMKVNKASPKLFLHCATGEHIKEATLTCRKAGKEQQEFLKYKFNDILISSYQTGGSGHSDVVPTDQISFNFVKLEVLYKPQKADGTLDAGTPVGYDLATQKAH
jgi:type VI secretion system secreted protein Hcp